MAINSERERLLCYGAGILGSMLANSTANADFEVKDWMIERSIRSAAKMIEMIYDDQVLAKILSGK